LIPSIRHRNDGISYPYLLSTVRDYGWLMIADKENLPVKAVDLRHGTTFCKEWQEPEFNLTGGFK